MSKEKQDLEFDAHRTIYTALKEFDAKQQRKILKSVLALLEIDSAQTGSTSRSLTLVDLLHQKSPNESSQLIALFAYYRERYELNRRFSRGDLEGYFIKAKLLSPANYDHHFVEAVKKGWIHEDGSDSYITSKGIEAVEASFANERKRTEKKKKSKISRKRIGH